MQLRPYQSDAVSAILADISVAGNSIVSLPTGAGKSLIIAECAARLNQPVLIVTPSKEIVVQDAEKMSLYVGADKIGIYSASLSSKKINTFTFATIQSIYRKPEDFAHFKIVFIDECDLLDPREMDTMFRSFLSSIGNPKVIGFSATAYRLSHNYDRKRNLVTSIKMINRIKTRGARGFVMFWDRIIFNLDPEYLIERGFLIRPTYYFNKLLDNKDIPINKSKTDFDLEKYQELITSREDSILDAVRRAKEKFRSILVFCASVEQAERFAETVKDSAALSSKTKAKDRDRIIKDFKSGTLRIVFNYTVLGVGFDYPALDCVVLVRPTRSLRLYYQFVGRAIRPATGKTQTTVIDFSDTVKTLGRIETIRLVKNAGLWNIQTERGLWHGKTLYSFKIL